MRTTKKRLEAIESICAHKETIGRIIWVVGRDAYNFWDVDSVTIRDYDGSNEITIHRTGNFKDYQSFIDLGKVADDLIETNQFGSMVVKCFNMAEGKNELWPCEVPEDVINVHLSEPIMSFERLYPDALNVYIPYNNRDPIK